MLETKETHKTDSGEQKTPWESLKNYKAEPEEAPVTETSTEKADDDHDEDLANKARSAAIEVLTKLKGPSADISNEEIEDKTRVQLERMLEREFVQTDELPLNCTRRDTVQEIRELEGHGKEDEVDHRMRMIAAYGEDIGRDEALLAAKRELNALEEEQTRLRRRGKDRNDMNKKRHFEEMRAMNDDELEVYGREKRMFHSLLMEAKEMWPEQYKKNTNRFRGRFDRRVPKRWDDPSLSMEHLESRYSTIRMKRVEEFCQKKGVDPDIASSLY